MASILRTNVVIPDVYAREIIQETIRESAALQLCRRMPMSTGTQKQPVLAALPVVSWVTPRDTGTKSTTSAEWSDVTVTAEEIAAIVPVPEAVIDDATFDIFGELRPLIAQAMGQAIDLGMFFGVTPTGGTVPATQPTGGIYQYAIDAGNETALTGSVDIVDDINSTMALVEEDGYDVTGFASAPTVKAMLRNLRDKDNRPVYQPSFQAGTPGELFGVPLLYNRNGGWDRTKALILAGDWSKAVIGIRQDMTAKVLSEATLTDGNGTVLISLAEQDMVALRVVMRLGFARANPVTVYGSTGVPFSVLHPAA